MFRLPLATGDTQINPLNFWNSIFLYHNSPHLVNRRVLSVSQLFFLKVKSNYDLQKIYEILKYSELYSQIYRIAHITSDSVNESIITNLFEQYGDVKFESKEFDFVKEAQEGVFISVRVLLPRSMKLQKCLEVVILNKTNNIARFMAISKQEPIISPNFAFDIELDKNKLMIIYVSDIETAELKASEWLAEHLFPKLISWTELREPKSPVQKSLSLIHAEEYCSLYQELKQKYGERIVKNWPENTDPLKFVYEDVAIATYLLLLWRRTSLEKQRYVDLGCGNGLLVYILSQEGHDGFGIDVRPRKIWKMYPESTRLKIQTIVPSSENLFPEVDWIIGNHSDELTPWIPVIAARSSHKCNYFLLPCCSYEFDGKKYQRVNASQSQYHEYLDYIKEISEICGFKTELDRLRIPSTKRICLIGVNRHTHDAEQVNTNITEFINTRVSNKKNANSTIWVDNYEARQITEPVRNCTKLDVSLIHAILNKIVTFLLAEKRYISLSNKQWNAGKIVKLPELVKLIPSEELKQLKNNCGGLQTLLKNHHYIFFVKNGTVQFRMPVMDVKKKVKHKTRKCWFFENHPDGCALEERDCSYLH